MASATPSGAAAVPALHPYADGTFMLAAIAGAVTIAGFASSYFAIRTCIRFSNFRQAAKIECETLAAAIAFRDALLAEACEQILVLPGGGSLDLSGSREANELLRGAMSGPDSKHIALALNGLLDRAAPFKLSARTARHEVICIRGKRLDGRAILLLKNLGIASSVDYAATLNAAPVPIWVRGPDMTLRWANGAFLDVTRADSLQNALASNVALQRSEIELATSARDGTGIIDATRYALIDGERHAFSLKFVRLPDASVAGIAIDVTGTAQAEAKLRLYIEAANAMLDDMPAAIAIFGEDRKLATYNSAFGALWGFEDGWLAASPTFGEILDRLRETRQVPEQADFKSWKAAQDGLFETCRTAHEEFWHLPSGKSLRIGVRPYLLGGLAFVIEDVSEKLRLEASFNLLLQAQRATLDTIDDGIAIFGPDGRLVLHNNQFQKLWHLTDEELCGEPHFSKVATSAQEHVGPDSIWRIVSAGVNSAQPERCNEWGKAVRADGRMIALQMSRLPDGATIVTFSDMTDVEKFQSQRKMSATNAA